LVTVTEEAAHRAREALEKISLPARRDLRALRAESKARRQGPKSRRAA